MRAAARTSGVTDRQHRLAHALLLVGLLVHEPQAQDVAVERDRFVQIGHGHAHVVDGGEHHREGLRHAAKRRLDGTDRHPDLSYLTRLGRRARRPSCPTERGSAVSDQPRSVIVAGARTPMGRLLGSLKDFSSTDLGGLAINGALEKAGIAATRSTT